MKKRIVFSLVLAFWLVLGTPGAVAQAPEMGGALPSANDIWTNAPAPWPDGCQECRSGPVGEVKVKCRPPSGWNGMLVVYAHGFVPPQLPLELPTAELSQSGQFIPALLMQLGFAFGTTSYSKNGYAVVPAEGDLTALVRSLQSEWHPAKTFIVGASEGGLITTMMIEKHPELFNGALAACGPLGGGLYQGDYMGDFRVVFDYYFPQVFHTYFGAFEVPPDEFLNWPADTTAIAGAMAADPEAIGQLMRVTKAAYDPADPLASSVSSAVQVLFYSIFETNDLISPEVANGIPYTNMGRKYWGSDDDWALNDGVERVAANVASRRWLAAHYTPNGRLTRPLVTLHTTLDPVVPYRHELLYLGQVARARELGHLSLITVPRCGHCAFTTQELLGAFAVLVFKSNGWLREDLKVYLKALPEESVPKE